MATFTTAGKRFAEGTVYASFGALDVGVPPPPAMATQVDQTAPAELPDAGGNRKFLFWDTGRQVTNKRHVQWTFNHSDTWTTWNAVAYYGLVSGGPPSDLVTVDSFWVGTGPIDPTAIDGPDSTFVNGPGAGQTAWPAGGNNHAVSTAWGAETIHALAHLSGSPSDPQLDFSSLTQLMYGGDDSSVFEENDDNLASGGGVTGIAATTAPQLMFPQHAGALVLAAYVLSAHLRVVGKPPVGVLGGGVISVVDPAPVDVLRQEAIASSIANVATGAVGADTFAGLVASAGSMSAAELTQAIASTRASLQRGQAALQSLEAAAAKGGAQG